MKIVKMLKNTGRIRPGNGIARQYQNAQISKKSGVGNMLGWGVVGATQVADTVVKKDALSGLAALASAALVKIGWNTMKSSKKVMKELEPEYLKILQRAQAMKKYAQQAK